MKKEYKFTYMYDLIDDFVFPTDLEEWENCPYCQAKPKVWIFDNGRHAGCKCHNNTYDHRNIQAISVNECYTKGVDYDRNKLKNNWNDWCKNEKQSDCKD